MADYPSISSEMNASGQVILQIYWNKFQIHYYFFIDPVLMLDWFT